MMGESAKQPVFVYNISVEDFVPLDHPLRAIRPFVNTKRIRTLCQSLYSYTGRPSIPPEQLFLALIGGYILSIPSERKLMMEIQCNMALRWFIGLGLDETVWDASTFSQNRRRRFDTSGTLEKLFDATLKEAKKRGLISEHASVDGTLVRANASYKSFVPIEVAMSGKEYLEKLRSEDKDDQSDPPDPGNPHVDFRGEKRSNQTHRSTTDPDCRFVSKGSSGTGAYPGYTVNAVMENRNRFLLGVGVDIFRGPGSETDGCIKLLDRVKKKVGWKLKTIGGDKGYFSKSFIDRVFKRRIKPHIAAMERGQDRSHRRVRLMARGSGYYWSQRCRKKIEELFGEAKDQHGMRRFRRRRLEKVREETWLIGWVLNLKRMAKSIKLQNAFG
jgi:transposase